MPTIAVAISSSGVNTLVAAVTSRKLRVRSYQLVAAGTVSLKFLSDGASDTDLTGAMPMVANGSLTSPHAPPRDWLFETLKGEGLSINLSDAVAVTGWVNYEDAPA